MCRIVEVDVGKSETKPELKRHLRALISQIRGGQVPKREGIGSDRPSTVAHRPPVVAAEAAKPQPIVQSPQPVAVPGTRMPPYAGAAFPPNAPSVSAASAGGGVKPVAQNWRPSNTATTASESSTRPSILEAGLITVCQDFVVPSALDRLSQTHRSALTRMSQFYDSLVSKNEHLHTPPKEAVARRSDASGPPVLSALCGNCGKKCNKDCKFRRCKACCNEALLRCPIHMAGWSLKNDDSLTDRAPILPTAPPMTSTPSVPKQVRKLAPPLPKPSSILLGEREAGEPWTEIREEALYRSVQNSGAMDTIFDHTTTNTLTSLLSDWQSRPQQPLEQRLAQLESESNLLTQKHVQTLAAWSATREEFYLKYAALVQAGTEQEMLETRRQFYEKIDLSLPIPLMPRKRTAEADPPISSASKVKPTKS